MNRLRRPAVRRVRAGERGMTLVELAIAWIVGVFLVTAMASAYTIGLVVWRPNGNGAQPRVAAAHDQMSFEQHMSQDVSRASCIATWFSAAQEDEYGSCGGRFTSVNGQCPHNALLCVGWPSLADGVCHGAVYLWDEGAVSRTEYTVASAGAPAVAVGFTDITSGRGSTSSTIQRTYAADASPPSLPATVAVTTVPSPTGSYTWVGAVTVSVTPATVTVNPQTATFVLRPAVRDPAGPAAASVSPAGALVC
ncbi:MAG TPA: hypothetical protein VFO60_02875 [Candidatus Dormibacteraeota bacterium]|nr:hypothetical protein [Candidatus Dormibacteraeota bacterium]